MRHLKYQTYPVDHESPREALALSRIALLHISGKIFVGGHGEPPLQNIYIPIILVKPFVGVASCGPSSTFVQPRSEMSEPVVS